MSESFMTPAEATQAFHALRVAAIARVAPESGATPAHTHEVQRSRGAKEGEAVAKDLNLARTADLEEVIRAGGREGRS